MNYYISLQYFFMFQMTSAKDLKEMIENNIREGFKCYAYSRCVTGRYDSINTSGQYIHISHVKFIKDGAEPIIMNVNTNCDPFGTHFHVDTCDKTLKLISELRPSKKYGPMPLMKFKAFPESLQLESVKIHSFKYTTEDSNELLKMRYYFDLWMKGSK